MSLSKIICLFLFGMILSFSSWGQLSEEAQVQAAEVKLQKAQQLYEQRNFELTIKELKDFSKFEMSTAAQKQTERYLIAMSYWQKGDLEFARNTAKEFIKNAASEHDPRYIEMQSLSITIQESLVIEPLKEDTQTVDKHPEPEEGHDNFKKNVQKRIHYPKAARNAKVEGTIYLQFMVYKDGSVGEIVLMKGLGYGLDEEAMRVIKATKWICSKTNGKSQDVKITYPVKFILPTP